MFNHLDKYRKRYTSALLLPYLFLIALSIFHYHHVNIDSGNYKIERHTGNGTANPSDSRDDLTHECVIMQFASTVLNYSFSFNVSCVKNTAAEDFHLTKVITFKYDSHYNSNPHRAPPCPSSII